MDKYEEAVCIVDNYVRRLKECYENACDIVGDKSKTPSVRAKQLEVLMNFIHYTAK